MGSIRDKLLAVSIKVGFFLTVFFIVGSIFVLVQQSSSFWLHFGISPLFEKEWFAPDHKFGMLSMLYGLVVVSFFALAFSFPLAMCVSILISEVFVSKVRLTFKILFELIAGTPGIIYGLIGLTILSPIMKGLFDLQTGNTFLTAGVLLAVFSFPIMVTFFDDAFQDIPYSYRLQAKALGFNKVQMIRFAVLPYSIKRLVSIVLLVLSRAMGDTIATLWVVGSIDRWPSPIYNVLQSGQTITSKLGREAAEAFNDPLHWSALMSLAFVLLVIVVSMAFSNVLFSYIVSMKRKV